MDGMALAHAGTSSGGFMTMAQKPGGIPMYASYLTFTTFLDWLKEMKVVPSQIDRSLWSSKFSGGNGAQLMTGLRFLGLLNGEHPSQALEPLVMADDVNRKELLKAVLERAYGEDMIQDLPKMTPGMLDRKLEELGTTNSTHRKALSFFVNASKAVNISVPSQIARKARNKPTPSTSSVKVKPKPPDPSPPPSSNGSGQEVEANPPEASKSLLLDGLFQRLPLPGAVFASIAREKWLEAAKAIFEIEYQPEESPISNSASTTE